MAVPTTQPEVNNYINGHWKLNNVFKVINESSLTFYCIYQKVDRKTSTVALVEIKHN